MQILSLLVISLTIQEPTRDSPSFRIVDEAGNLLGLLLSQFTCSNFRVDTKDLAYEEPEPTTNTSDGLKGIRHSPHAINVCVENTQDVLEVIDIFQDEGHT